MNTEIAKHNAEHDGNIVADNRYHRKRVTEETRNDESDKKSDCPCDHIPRRHLAKLPLHPHGETSEASREERRERIADHAADSSTDENAEKSRRREPKHAEFDMPERCREIAAHRRNRKLKQSSADNRHDEHNEKT